MTETQSSSGFYKYQKSAENAPPDTNPNPKLPNSPIRSQNDSAPKYLTVSELMDELRVSRDTIYRILGRGEMAFIRTGKRSIRVHRDALETWRREQEETSKKKGPTPSKVPAPDPQGGSALESIPE